MEVDLVMLRSKFYLRLSDAAKSFGISVTSLKQVCRKLGFKRWPRRLTPRKAHRIHASCSSSGGSSTDLRSTPPDCGSCDEDDELYDSSKRHRAELRSRSSAETRLSLSTDGSSSCSTSRSSQSKRKYIYTTVRCVRVSVKNKFNWRRTEREKKTPPYYKIECLFALSSFALVVPIQDYT